MPTPQPPIRQPWMDDAACTRPDVQPNWWFTDDPRAALYCASCDAQHTCLEYALNNPDLTAGIWAGLHISQIRRMRRNLR